MSKLHNKYGCMPPKTDVRDYKLAKTSTLELPKKYSILKLPKVKNQKNVSSCVAHATSSILEYHDLGIGNHTLSTNFIYGIQKQLCGHEGSGMYLRDACKIAATYGDALESECPGNNEVPECWEIAEKALNPELNNGKTISDKFKIKSYFNCSDESDIKNAIFKYGPVLCSIKWYDTFKCDKDGVLNGEKKGDYGYHAVMMYGWDETGFLCQNSWGKNWGNNGRFILPYSIGVRDAKGFVDLEDPEIIVPKRNSFLDIVYKIVNFILNLFKN
jgi:cathepsin C